MSGFTKLHQSIIHSSIWNEDDKTRLMFITMLALADENGHVTGSIPGMATMARMSVRDAEESIGKLLAPDPYSQSQLKSGARICEVESGGWDLVNFKKYRELGSREQRKEQNREAKRRQRERQKSA